MSFRLVADALDYAPVKGTTLIILIALAEFANDDDTAWPSVKTLARRSRCTPRNVRKAMNELESKGLVRRLPNAGPKGVNRYVITIQPMRSEGSPDQGEKISPLNSGRARGGPQVPPEPPAEPPVASHNGKGGSGTAIEEPSKSNRALSDSRAILARIYAVWKWPEQRKTKGQRNRDLASARELLDSGCGGDDVELAAYAMTQDPFYKFRAGLSVQRLADEFENLLAMGRRLGPQADDWQSHPAAPIAMGDARD